MRLGILTAAALALTASAANASWTGCRVGGTLGMTATVTDVTLSSPFAPGASLGLDGFGTDGADVGILAGCDLQVGDRFVIGAFADWVHRDHEWALTGTDTVNSFKLSTDMGNQWTIGARAGVLMTPTTLGYLMVGYTRAEGGDIGLTANGTSLGSVSLGDFEGYMIGGGIETEFAKNFVIGLEYRLQSFDTRTLDLGGANLDFDTDAHSVRLNVAWKFGASEVLQPMK